MLKARDVVMCFGPKEREEVVLRALNFEMDDERVVGVLGNRKSGKTTLAAVLSGVVKPVNGQVESAVSRLLLHKYPLRGIPQSRLKDLVTSQLEEARMSHAHLLVVDDADAFPANQLAELTRSRASRDLSTILVSSETSVLKNLSDSIFILEHGRLVLKSSLTAQSPTVIYSVNELLERASDTLVASGTRKFVAKRVASILVDADVRGHASHGVILLPMYLERIAQGGINPDADPVWIRQDTNTSILDAQSGFGQLAADQASRVCAETAAKQGVAAVAVRHNNHVGMMSAYRWPFQQNNVVGLLMTISGPSVAPPGASKATLGSNAVCLVAPTADRESEPFVIDLGTGIVAAGKIRAALARGEKVPSSWLLDAQGQPTTDPSQLDKDGSISVFGGYKGLAISLVVEVLAGILGGSTVSPQVNKQRRYLNRPMDCSQLFVGFSSNFFGVSSADEFIQTLHDATVSGYSSAPRMPYFPNQLEKRQQRAAATAGVRVPRAVAEKLGWV